MPLLSSLCKLSDVHADRIVRPAFFLLPANAVCVAAKRNLDVRSRNDREKGMSDVFCQFALVNGGSFGLRPS